MIRGWQEQADVSGRNNRSVTVYAMAASTLAIEPLGNIADALDAAEDASLAILRRTAGGQEVAKDYAAEMTERKRQIGFSVRMAVMDANMAETSDEISAGLLELQQKVKQMRERRRVGHERDMPGGSSDEHDGDKPHAH